VRGSWRKNGMRSRCITRAPGQILLDVEESEMGRACSKQETKSMYAGIVGTLEGRRLFP
jgi:hypothetical protein